MKHDSKLDWQAHLSAGRRYLKTAINGQSRTTVFSNQLIYQLTAMAIEHLLVGVYQYYKKMPIDHTLDGLVDGLDAVCPLDPNLADSIKTIGRYDDMCPLVPPKQSVPNDLQIKAILAVGKQVVGFTELHIESSKLEKADLHCGDILCG